MSSSERSNHLVRTFIKVINLMMMNWTLNNHKPLNYYSESEQMKISDFIKPELGALTFIAGVFPQGCLTLLHGEQGSGKSYSCISELNKDGITPIYVAVEDSYGLSSLNKHYVGEELLTIMKDEECDKELIDELRGKVIIIDTYSRLQYSLTSEGYTNSQILGLLERLVNQYSVTIIVIGHTRAFVGKDGIFDDNVDLVRGVSEELFLEKSVYKKTKLKPAYIEYNLHVKKGRGSGGAKILSEWAR